MTRTYVRRPLAERLAARSQPQPDGCIHFMGALRPDGYGEIGDGEGKPQKRMLAHRAAWTVVYGPIPDGLCVLHRCDNRQCINPDHLFLGTRLDNNRDKCAKGRHHNQLKTHCRNGHPLDGDNLLLRDGARQCRTCIRAAKNRYNKKIRGAG